MKINYEFSTTKARLGSIIVASFSNSIRKFSLAFLFILLTITNVSAANNLTYELELSGLDGKEFEQITKTFSDASILKTQKTEPIVSVTNLKGRIKTDIDTLQRILRSNGFYRSEVGYEIARWENNFEIVIKVSLGPIYTFGEVNISYLTPQPSEEIKLILNENLFLLAGSPAIAEEFIKAESKIINALPENGFPFAKIVEKDLVVDHQTSLLNINFTIDSGARATMGAVTFKGLTSVNEGSLQKFITWAEGVYFKQGYINNLRKRLNNSNLFETVAIEIVPTQSHRVDAIISLIESKHKSVSLTASFSSSEGFGGDASWEHNNLFGKGNKLKLIARLAEIEQSLVSRFEIPNFKRLDQNLFAEAAYKRLDTDAYFANVVKIGAGISRVLTPHLSGFIRTEFEFNDITDVGIDDNYYLASIPVGLRWDNSDDLLDPRSGFRASVTTAPSIDLSHNSATYLKSELRASAYYSVFSQERFTLAARTRIGTITSSGETSLPATQRFFSGGGGSVRGFSYQAIGPKDADGEALGGNSVVEIGGEARWKISNTIGIVPFIEGGSVSTKQTPQFKDFRWGVGVGARYYTSFGPIRLDVAFPLDRQTDESSVQVYLSLGQAF